jgi:hypothetical protein
MFTVGEIAGQKHIEQVAVARDRFDLVRCLQGGGVAVIVGGRTTNFTDAQRRDPRFEFWDSTDPRTPKRDLPSNARAVIFTRYLSHHTDIRLRKQAKKRGIFCLPGFWETGELREELQRVVDHREPKPLPPEFKATKQERAWQQMDELLTTAEVALAHPWTAKTLLGQPAPDPEPETPQEQAPVPVPATIAEAEGGEGPDAEDDTPPPHLSENLPVWVKRYARLDVVADRMTEAARVLAVMERHGRKSTVKSVLETMRLLQREAGVPGMRKSRTTGPRPAKVPVRPVLRKKRTPEAIDAAVVQHADDEAAWEAPVVVPPVVKVPPVVPPVAVAQARGDALIQSIEEAERYIADMASAAALLGELMPRLKDEIAKFRERQRRAAELFLD